MIIPARSINFTHSNGKQIIAQRFNDGIENSCTDSAAALAGIVTGTATNLALVKARLRLTADHAKVVESTFIKSLVFNLDIVKQTAGEEGIHCFYIELNASSGSPGYHPAGALREAEAAQHRVARQGKLSRYAPVNPVSCVRVFTVFPPLCALDTASTADGRRCRKKRRTCPNPPSCDH